MAAKKKSKKKAAPKKAIRKALAKRAIRKKIAKKAVKKIVKKKIAKKAIKKAVAKKAIKKAIVKKAIKRAIIKKVIAKKSQLPNRLRRPRRLQWKNPRLGKPQLPLPSLRQMTMECPPLVECEHDFILKILSRLMGGFFFITKNKKPSQKWNGLEDSCSCKFIS